MGEKPKLFDSPSEIRIPGWKKILLRVKDQIAKDHLMVVAAGVAFYSFLALFPAIMAIFSIYGLATDPQQAEAQIAELADLMPEEAFSIIEGRIKNLLATPTSALGWGTILGFLVSIWSANQGMKSLFTGLDIAYNTVNKRNFFKQTALTLFYTLCAIIVLIISMTLIVIFPAIVQFIGLPDTVEDLITWLRWPLLAMIVIAGISVVYKYAPDRETPKFRWVFLGAAIATLLWLLASLAFSTYVSNFGNYGEMYGSISAVVVMLLWLFISSFIILLGGELNSATEAYAENYLEDDQARDSEVNAGNYPEDDLPRQERNESERNAVEPRGHVETGPGKVE